MFSPQITASLLNPLILYTLAHVLLRKSDIALRFQVCGESSMVGRSYTGIPLEETSPLLSGILCKLPTVFEGGLLVVYMNKGYSHVQV
jgi:hypothetical protein